MRGASLLAEIGEKLLEVRDVDGTPVVTKVKITDEIYPGADPRIAPDLIVGYNDAYRASWDTVLGGVAPEIVEDNLDRWSGEHLIDPDLVPGVLVANRAGDRAPAADLRHRAHDTRRVRHQKTRTDDRARTCSRRTELAVHAIFSSSRSIRIDKRLYEGLAAVAQREGYASVDELILHVLERKVAGIDDELDAKRTEQQLRGLGYLE